MFETGPVIIQWKGMPENKRFSEKDHLKGLKRNWGKVYNCKSSQTNFSLGGFNDKEADNVLKFFGWNFET